MNSKSYLILEDVISDAGKWTSLELVNDTIYIDFSSVELFNNNDSSRFDSDISIRFSDNSLFSIFYNNKEDIDFLNLIKGNDDNFSIEFNKNLEKNKFKFQNMDFINSEFSKFKNEMIFLDNFNNKDNPDFILSFLSEDIGLCFGGNSLNVYMGLNELTDNDILILSNKWAQYYLSYWKNKGTRKEYDYDAICELNPININKKSINLFNKFKF
ncbi:hypothetical protein BGI41_04660 [Methanobrevibacter sp. 87.7]|uniref:hypothetical protein n=1 Tax=Methanobrevibacter sp. 87.7 TaxID=387957 RepID=UPI000B6E1787|nr:hypothetical protein [Methanobrevibacter sp. 87.7]OWT33000.1 hypothetical protein BGI41_04660 [Methanobrevibacter sp. 87.7]